MIPPQLPLLPIEIYHRICALLPCSSALSFLLVNRIIYKACNDWTVWRDIIKHDRDMVFERLAKHIGHTQSWKRYVVAVSKAHTVARITTTDVARWLPQLISLNCKLIRLASWIEKRSRSQVVLFDIDSTDPVISATSTTELASFCDFVFHTPCATSNTELTALEFCPKLGSVHNIQTWQLAQASAFCLSAHLLSERCPNLRQSRLDSVPWASSSGVSKDSAEYPKLITMQHALANRAIGYFYIQLRCAMIESHPSPSVAGALPPTFESIPVSAMMEIPEPFSHNAIQRWCQCHLATMLNPNFFIDGQWTGFFSVNLGTTSAFDGIGCRNTDLVYDNDIGQWQGSGQFPYGRTFESVVQFQLTDYYGVDDEVYTLQSNNFYSEAELHNLTIKVERRTGSLRIHHWHRLELGAMITDAVITPFGIVSCIVPNTSWLWMWKKDWPKSLADIR